MTWCEECNFSTLELCSGNLCRRCCQQRHDLDCDKFEGAWVSRTGKALFSKDDDD